MSNWIDTEEKTKYRFVGRDADRLFYIFESTLPAPGDSRYERVTVSVRYFWSNHETRQSLRNPIGVGTTT